MFISTMKYLFALFLAIGVAGAAPTLSAASSNSCMSDCTANSINDIANFVINNSNLLPSLMQKIQEAGLNVDGSGSQSGSELNQGKSGSGNLIGPVSGIFGNLGNLGNQASNGVSGSNGNGNDSGSGSGSGSGSSGSSPTSGTGSPISTSSITSALSGLGGASPLSTVLNKINTLEGGSLDGLISKLPSSALNQMVNPSSIVKQLSGTSGGQVPASSIVSSIIGQLPSSTISDIQKQGGNVLDGLVGQSGNIAGNVGNLAGLVSSVGSIGSGSDALTGLINKLVPSGKIPASTIKNVISTSNPTWASLFNAIAPSDVLKSLPSSILSAFNQPIDASILGKLTSITGTLPTSRLASLLSSSGIASTLQTLTSNGANQIGQITQNIGNVAGQATGQVSGLSGQISGIASGIINDLLSSGKTVDASLIKNAISGVSGSTVGSVLSPLCQVIGKSSSSLPSSLLNQALSSSVTQQLKSLTGNVPMSKVLSMVLTPSTIQQITSNGAGQVSESGQNTVDQVSNSAGGASQATSGAGQAAGEASSGIGGLSDSASGLISNTANGLSGQASSSTGSGSQLSGQAGQASSSTGSGSAGGLGQIVSGISKTTPSLNAESQAGASASTGSSSGISI